jgi:shikimate dehydrogenase
MKLFSIFGNPVSHSISPKMHNQALSDLKIQGCYIRTCITDPNMLMKTFQNLKLDGANVTVPHKEVAFLQCDKVDSLAKQIGAVNTLVRNKEEIYGYNTDAPGFYKAIQSFGKINNVLILGAGGTAKAVATILREKSLHVTILNRSKQRLASFEKQDFECYSWDDFPFDSYDLIVNTTSAGLHDNNLPLETTLLEALMQKSKFAFDVIYNKQTPFLQFAKQNSLLYKDGADMLLYQGVLAFNLFFSNKYDEAVIEKSMKKIFK